MAFSPTRQKSDPAPTPTTGSDQGRIFGETILRGRFHGPNRSLDQNPKKSEPLPLLVQSLIRETVWTSPRNRACGPMHARGDAHRGGLRNLGVPACCLRHVRRCLAVLPRRPLRRCLPQDSLPRYACQLQFERLPACCLPTPPALASRWFPAASRRCPRDPTIAQSRLLRVPDSDRSQ